MECKPLISYAGDEALFSSLQFGLVQQLSVEQVEWRRSYGRAAKTVCVEGSFVKFEDEIIAKENDWKLIGQTFFHTYWTDCTDVDQYKTSVKDDIQAWLTTLRNHSVHDWMIITVETIDGRKGNKAKLLPRASVIDKIRSEFCSRQPDRCIALLDPLKSDARGAESWQSLLQRIRQLTLQAYNRNLSKFEEHMRSQRERRNEPGWSFCEYFVLQEELAFVFEMLGIYDEALVQYDELDALFTQFVLNSNVGDTPQWLHEFSRTCDSWMGLTLTKNANNKKRELIAKSKASLLDLRNYLFSRQCNLLLLLFRPWEIAQRTLPFLHNCINELQILEVAMPLGAVSCWVFLSALEVLQTCERFNDSSHVEAYSLYTAGLWAYTRDKLQELGTMCGLMPGYKETSEQLQMVVGLLSGMNGDESEDSSKPQTPMNKLREALSSRDMFQHHYLELSELAMGTFKHIGRIRSARLIGKDLANFYMKLGEPQKAAAFHLDLLKTSLKENWLFLVADTQLELVKCYRMMQDYEKCIKMLGEIASSHCIDKEIRQAHFTEMLIWADKYPKDHLLIAASPMFSVESVSVSSDSDIIIWGSNITVSLELTNNLIKELKCTDISVSVCFRREDAHKSKWREETTSGYQDGYETTSHSSRNLKCKDWTTRNVAVPIEMEEQFEYKQDHSLKSASLACANLQNVLRRRDSHSGLCKEKDIVKGDFSNCFSVQGIVLQPGKNVITFRCKAGHPGVYSLNQLSIEINKLEFLVLKISPVVTYKVICEQPKMFLQRACKGDLVAGAEQELMLTVHTGSKIIELDTAVRLQASNGLLLKVEEDGEDEPVFMQAVECLLPMIGPFQTATKRVKVLADIVSQKDSGYLERKVSLSSPWTTEKQESLLIFVLPFAASHKIQTANNKKYIQVTIQGLREEAFYLHQHHLKVTNCEEASVTSLNPSDQQLVVCKEQNVIYLWQLTTPVTDAALHLEFTVNYCSGTKATSVLQSKTTPNIYKHHFDILEYKTLYTITSNVEPLGSEFCRIGSICHMNITIGRAHKSEYSSLMYEVLADQLMWAVCGRTAGVAVMGSDDKHSVTLDVMPLTRGFLPLPVVRLSKYISGGEGKNYSKDGSKRVELSSTGASQYPRVEPFTSGQVYNWTKSVQIHVLPALGTSSDLATT